MKTFEYVYVMDDGVQKRLSDMTKAELIAALEETASALTFEREQARREWATHTSRHRESKCA